MLLIMFRRDAWTWRLAADRTVREIDIAFCFKFYFFVVLVVRVFLLVCGGVFRKHVSLITRFPHTPKSVHCSIVAFLF